MLLDDAELERQLRETMERAASPVLGEGVDEDAVRQDVERRQAARRRKKWGGRLGLGTLAVAAAVAAVMFVATRPDNNDVEVGPSKDPDRVTTTSPETTLPDEEPSTTTAPSTTTSSSTPTSSSTTTTSSTVPPLPEFPTEMDIVHGAKAWALYLAVAPEGQNQDPELVAAAGAMVDAGYWTDASPGGSLGCDWDAPAALGRDGNSIPVAAYFETEAIANQAREAFAARGQESVGIVYTTVGCLD
jgi:hypothetical protein